MTKSSSRPVDGASLLLTLASRGVSAAGFIPRDEMNCTVCTGRGWPFTVSLKSCRSRPVTGSPFALIDGHVDEHDFGAGFELRLRGLLLLRLAAAAPQTAAQQAEQAQRGD